MIESKGLGESTKARGSSRAELYKNILLTLPFLLLFLVQLAHHQLWRDELNAFGLAAASPNLRTLFSYVHYEGHPWLWYVLLWGVTRLTVLPIALKVVQAVIGTAIYLMIGVASPFSRVEKLLLFVCYFVSFEYTVLTRMYGVMLLLLLLYIWRRARYPERVVGNAVLLGLLAGTDMIGLILSVGLACEFAWSIRKQPAVGVPVTKKKLLQGALVYCAMAAFSVFSLIPARDISTRTTGRIFDAAGDLRHLFYSGVNNVAVPYFPALRGPEGSFWNPLALDHRLLFILATPLILGAYWVVFRKHGNLLVLMGSTIVMKVCFSHLVYMGSTRHFGIIFIAFVAGLWLMRYAGEKLPWPAYALLALTAAGGVYAGIETWRRPFSNAQQAAGWLQSHHMDKMPWVGSPDTSVMGVAQLLGRPVYMLDCECIDTFLLFSNRRDPFSIAQIPERLVNARNTLKANEFVYIGVVPFRPDQEVEIRADGFILKPLVHFENAEESQENFYLYDVSSVPGT